jgi:hypothetical protein
MRKILTILILTLNLTSYGQEFEFDYNKDFDKILEQSNDPVSDLNYDKLLERFKSNDTTLTDFDVLVLLIGYTDDPNYHAYDDIATEREIYKLNGDGKFNEAKEKGLKFNTTHPLNQMTLIELSYSYYKLEMQDSSNYYSYQFGKVMDAMMRSGKGTSADAAFFSLTPIDGQNLIIKYLGAKIGKMGSGRDSNGNFVDILGYISKTDENEVPLYFQIEHATKETKLQLGDELKKAAKKKKK